MKFLRQPGYLIFKVYFCNIIGIVTQLGWFTELVISCIKQNKFLNILLPLIILSLRLSMFWN